MCNEQLISYTVTIGVSRRGPLHDAESQLRSCSRDIGGFVFPSRCFMGWHLNTAADKHFTGEAFSRGRDGTEGMRMRENGARDRRKVRTGGI